MVIDSWPLLERARRGRESRQLEALFSAADNGRLRLLMSEVNLGEFFYLLAKDFGSIAAEAALQAVAQLPLKVMPIEAGDGMRAARLKARFSISYADCFCANLAIAHNAPVLTGDRDFLKLQETGLLRVEWLGT